MRGTLMLAILSIKSSYIQDIEEAATASSDVPDTLQWWIAPTGSWRIRTYAIDHDIHTFQLSNPPPNLLDVVRENNRKRYADVTAAEFEFNFADCTNKAEIDAAFSRTELEPRLEIAAGRFAFWKPDDARYRTQSSPK
jgi:hypothetical protein